MSECILERTGWPTGKRKEIWHVVGAGKRDSWFCPVACDEHTGIVAPGPSYDREPTCPECRALQAPAAPRTPRLA